MVSNQRNRFHCRTNRGKNARFGIKGNKITRERRCRQMVGGAKKEPSATWLGNLLDRFLGWGNYYPTGARVATVSRTLFENSDKNEQEGCEEPWHMTVEVNVTTSFEVQTYANHTCTFLKPEDYLGKIFKWGNNVPNGYEDMLCHIEECIKDNLKYCQPTCLPCQNATEQERSKFYNGSFVASIGGSKVVPNLLWYMEVYSKQMANIWKTEQVLDVLFDTIKECEARALPKNPSTNVGWFVVPFVACGAITIFYFICRPKPPNQDYIPLPDQLDSLPETVSDP